jgi:tight adherence protein C
MPNIFLLLGIVLFLIASGVAVWAIKGGQSTITAEDLIGGGIHQQNQDLRQAVMNQSAKDRAIKPALDKIYQVLRKITPVGWIDTIEQRLMLADSKTRVEFILLQKVILGGLFFLLFDVRWDPFFWGTFGHAVLFVVKPAVGFFIPDLLLKNKADKRQGEILKSLPDVLDQITVGVEAGLGFDAAMARTAKSTEGPFAQELMRTLQHVAAGLSRAEALRGLANRNKVPELRQFVGAILQAEQYGVPMAQVLRVQAAEQRRRRRQRAEEKAMKLPVKVLFPLVLCILPTLFIVLIGPAGINIANNI